MKKNNWKIILILLSFIFFILFPVALNFTTLPLWPYYIINHLAYIFFWIIPIYIGYKNKKNNKYYITIFMILIIVFSFLAYFWTKYWEKQSLITISLARDLNRYSDYNQIKKILNKYDNDELKFTSFNDFKKQFNMIKFPPKNCYYLANNNLWYVLAIKFESEKYIKEFWEVFIYKSNQDYIISDKEMEKIKQIVTNKCK